MSFERRRWFSDVGALQDYCCVANLGFELIIPIGFSSDTALFNTFQRQIWTVVAFHLCMYVSQALAHHPHW